MPRGLETIQRRKYGKFTHHLEKRLIADQLAKMPFVHGSAVSHLLFGVCWLANSATARLYITSLGGKIPEPELMKHHTHQLL